MDKANIHYLPIGLTTSQVDLIEILISLHAHSLLKECAKRYNNDSKGADVLKTEDHQGKYPIIPQKRMTYMLDANIRAIANHPSLLVDHYIPRQFLRMEPTEISITSSDKFKKLNTILSMIIQRDRKQFPKPLKVCLISHSIKELDLIEGLVLGKYFKIKRFSGTPLYDEKHDLPYDMPPKSAAFSRTSNTSGGKRGRHLSTRSTESSTTDVTINTKSTNSNSTNTASVASSPNDSDSKTTDSTSTYTGYTKDTYHYSRKMKKQLHPDIYIDDWLFLTTTRHLTHDPTLLNNINVDLIICFDPLLDPSLPGVSSIRNVNGKSNPIPLIKLVVCNSPDHFMLERTLLKNEELIKSKQAEDGKLDDDSLEYVNTVDGLMHFLLTRSKYYRSMHGSDELQTDVDYQRLITSLLRNENCNNVVPQLRIESFDFKKAFNEQASIFEPRLSKLKYSNSELKIFNTVFDIKSYQSTLMKQTVERLKDLENEKEENEKVILRKRLHSTETQNELDGLKQEIGVFYKKFKDDEKSMIDSEKRLERANAETSKLRERISAVEEQKAKLESLINLSTDQEMSSQMEELNELIRKTRVNLKELRTQNEQSSNENDELRSQYQLDSSKAAESASTLSALRTELEDLNKLLSGPALKLKVNALTAEEKRVRKELYQIQAKSKYLKHYIELMESQYSLKTNGAPNSSVGGRTSNNSTRIRSTRSATPSYT
ncbi:uncharacterized protein HLK63_H01111 [Nakaseomyces glabratus]|nr:Class II histone deacetylase complex subunits 2 and 3 [Nakaseomyces glabratus]KAH7600658.1 Class II histone deacetylase complex subunits 2 and 3 [Nakaseomyces glabratus]UCS20823.1 uncharacterized protein GW608_H01111 [Nakaseomyces glabratus]UCS26054.1 uncharacterized protein HLK63_H01111 [Nakaseomyces glabratus]UCS31284.1 uncharacterized protein HLK64_H01111 [Nakaseomyces glabratus]